MNKFIPSVKGFCKHCSNPFSMKGINAARNLNNKIYETNTTLEQLLFNTSSFYRVYSTTNHPINLFKDKSSIHSQSNQNWESNSSLDLYERLMSANLNDITKSEKEKKKIFFKICNNFQSDYEQKIDRTIEANNSLTHYNNQMKTIHPLFLLDYLSHKQKYEIVNLFQIEMSTFLKWMIELRYRFRYLYGGLTKEMKEKLREFSSKKGYILSKQELLQWSTSLSVGQKVISNYLTFQRLRAGGLPKSLRISLKLICNKYLLNDESTSKKLIKLSKEYNISMSRILFYVYQFYYRKKNTLKKKSITLINENNMENLQKLTKKNYFFIADNKKKHIRDELELYFNKNELTNRLIKNELDELFIQSLSSKLELPTKNVSTYIHKYLHEKKRSGVLTRDQKTILLNWMEEQKEQPSNLNHLINKTTDNVQLSTNHISSEEWKYISDKADITVPRAKAFFKQLRHREKSRNGSISPNHRKIFQLWLNENSYEAVDATILNRLSKETGVQECRIREYLYRRSLYIQRKITTSLDKSC